MATATATKRKLVLKMSISLDGFVAGPNGEGDWMLRSRGDDSREWVGDTLRGAGVHIMGSRTYCSMAAFWPYSDSPLASAMNDIPKVIFARNGIKDGPQANVDTGAVGVRPGLTPTAAVLKSWSEPAVARGDLAEEILRLKEQPGDYILAQGGVRFAQSLAASGLIDEYRMVIHPIALGQGQSLFSAVRSSVDLRLISTTPFSSGVVAAVYHPA